MRCAYICADSGVPVFGSKGCSIHVQELISALLQADVAVSLFANHVEGQAPAALRNVSIYPIPRYAGKDIAEKEEFALAANRQLPLLLNSGEPFDFVYERYSLWSFGTVEWAARKGIFTIVEVNAPLIDEQASYRQLVHTQEAEQATRRLFQAASCIIVVSNELREYVLRFHIDAKKLHVMPNGVNPFRFPRHPDASRLPDPEVFTIGFVGTFKPWHGLLELIEAFQMLHQKDTNVRLLMIGDGPQRNQFMKDLQAKNLLHAARFTGMVDPAKIPSLLASVDVAVAPYPKSESHYFSPLKVYEYMAAGLPVVASAIGQLKEIIENDVNGLLYPPGDGYVMARALERLRQSPNLRIRLGLAARATVLRNHTWIRNAERVVALVNSHRQNVWFEAKEA